MRALIFAVFACATVVAIGQDATQKAREVVADLIARRDAMTQYAVVLFGTSGPEQKIDRRCPDVHVQVVDKARDFELKADYIYGARWLESGKEVVTTGTQHKWRKYPVTSFYTVGPRHQEVPHEFNATGHSIFDSYMTVWDFDDKRYGDSIEAHLKRNPLQHATMQDGKLVATFARLNATADWVVSFDPAVEYMPVESKIQVRKTGKVNYSMRIDWGQVAGKLLPTSIEYRYGVRAFRGPEITAKLHRHKFYWCIGDDIPEAVFDGPDHLLPLLDHFQLPHSRYDQVRDLWVASDLWTPLSLPVPEELARMR